MIVMHSYATIGNHFANQPRLICTVNAIGIIIEPHPSAASRTTGMKYLAGNQVIAYRGRGRWFANGNRVLENGGVIIV